jgi:hypothetical protein
MLGIDRASLKWSRVTCGFGLTPSSDPLITPELHIFESHINMERYTSASVSKNWVDYAYVSLL